MFEDLIGTVVLKIRRGDRQVYVARAQLATGIVVEALIEADFDIPFGRCIFNETNALIAGRNLAVSRVAQLRRGESSIPAPRIDEMVIADTLAARMGIKIDFVEEAAGMWALLVGTERGTVTMPIFPDETWGYVMGLAGLGT